MRLNGSLRAITRTTCKLRQIFPSTSIVRERCGQNSFIKSKSAQFTTTFWFEIYYLKLVVDTMHFLMYSDNWFQEISTKFQVLNNVLDL